MLVQLSELGGAISPIALLATRLSTVTVHRPTALVIYKICILCCLSTPSFHAFLFVFSFKNSDRNIARHYIFQKVSEICGMALESCNLCVSIRL